MIEPMTTETMVQLACRICLSEIPASAKDSPEAQDYVLYYCGIDCFDEWKRQRPAPTTASTSRSPQQ